MAVCVVSGDPWREFPVFPAFPTVVLRWLARRLLALPDTFTIGARRCGRLVRAGIFMSDT
jgi:hypothetical protein